MGHILDGWKKERKKYCARGNWFFFSLLFPLCKKDEIVNLVFQTKCLIRCICMYSMVTPQVYPGYGTNISLFVLYGKSYNSLALFA